MWIYLKQWCPGGVGCSDIAAERPVASGLKWKTRRVAYGTSGVGGHLEQSLKTMFRMWVSFSLDLFHQNSIKSTFSKHQWFKGMQLKMAHNNNQNRRCSTKMTHWLPMNQEMWWILETVFYWRNKAHCGTGWLDWRKYRNPWCERVTVSFAVLSSKLKGHKAGSDMLHTFYILYRFGYICIHTYVYVYRHVNIYTLPSILFPQIINEVYVCIQCQFETY